MAFDTQNARASVLRLNSPYVLVFPDPAGSFSTAGAQISFYQYAGLAPPSPVIPPFVNYFATLTEYGGYIATMQS